MCAVANRLGIKRIAVLSGVPGGGPHDRVPNWIVPSILDGLDHAYRWQWEKKLIPYWREACDVAAVSDVTICMEPIAGLIVYNGETFLRLREACGDNLCVTFDPSHFWWQGIDPLVLVEQLQGAIGYVHAKDVALNTRAIACKGSYRRVAMTTGVHGPGPTARSALDIRSPFGRTSSRCFDAAAMTTSSRSNRRSPS
ncbi:hypothetical protein FDG2_2519 [Candidatus Protofrankia californiensis]|uniref:Xylose isomerase-like TIM barrel domain-containing protein n=1 Tax=Candidatus Protofrankia californiensis TaxID=1839754 RepID=A0A1C3NXP6_9ACTN|nr:hypothetical protein FDG2_2519 [Candidatus Protofrankia californiensis]